MGGAQCNEILGCINSGQYFDLNSMFVSLFSHGLVGVYVVLDMRLTALQLNIPGLNLQSLGCTSIRVAAVL